MACKAGPMLKSDQFSVLARLAAFGAIWLGMRQISALDLSRASVDLPPNLSRVEMNAARMLNDEIAKRTQIRLSLNKRSGEVPLICLGTARNLLISFPNLDRGKLVGLESPDSFRIWIESSEAQPRVVIAGADDRGVLFGIGYFLRKLELAKQKVSMVDNFQ